MKVGPRGGIDRWTTPQGGDFPQKEACPQTPLPTPRVTGGVWGTHFNGVKSAAGQSMYEWGRFVSLAFFICRGQVRVLSVYARKQEKESAPSAAKPQAVEQRHVHHLVCHPFSCQHSWVCPAQIAQLQVKVFCWLPEAVLVAGEFFWVTMVIHIQMHTKPTHRGRGGLARQNISFQPATPSWAVDSRGGGGLQPWGKAFLRSENKAFTVLQNWALPSKHKEKGSKMTQKASSTVFWGFFSPDS